MTLHHQSACYLYFLAILRLSIKIGKLVYTNFIFYFTMSGRITNNEAAHCTNFYGIYKQAIIISTFCNKKTYFM